MIRRYAAELRAVLLLSDAALATIVFLAVSRLRFGPEWEHLWRAQFPQPELMLGLYVLVWVVALGLNGLYRPRFRWTVRAEAVDILRATAWSGIATFAFLFVVKMPEVTRLFLMVMFATQAAASIVSRTSARLLLRRFRARGRNSRTVLVIGAGPRGRAYASKIEALPWLGLRVVGFLDEDPAYAEGLPERWPYLGGLDRLPSVLHGRVIDEVHVCGPMSQWPRLEPAIHISSDEGKVVRLPLPLLDRDFLRGQFEELDGYPVYSLVAGPDRAVALTVKRALDVAGALVGLVALSPVFAAVALAIWRRDGRPILFRQERVGLHGRPFRVLKFRTMCTNAEARYAELAAQSDTHGAAFKMKDDPRITPLGRFLRRTSLDELPQLWNVLRGEMSLVGPRPAPAREVAEYDVWHRRRLSMKPGITGLWQVASRFDEDFDQRANLDLTYIDGWSVALDLSILLRTVPAVLNSTGR